MKQVEKPMSDQVAYYLWQIAQGGHPVKADKERGGLSDEGVVFYSKRLQRTLQPLFEGVSGDSNIYTQAKQYKEEIQPELEGGTCIFGLNEAQREELFGYLEKNGCTLDPWLQGTLDTSLTI